MSNRNITIINDCNDANAFGRQAARASSLIDGNVSFVGVLSDLEAAGNLVDILDAYENRPSVVLVNVAPRNGMAKKWENGTPFCYFRYKKTLVLSSTDGLVLSLIKKLNLVDNVCMLDLPSILPRLIDAGSISVLKAEYILSTQFRSYEFLPLAAQFLIEQKGLPCEKAESLKHFLDAPQSVWWVDNFGNCKTTLLKGEIEVGVGNVIKTKVGDFNFFDRLKDVPDKMTAIVVGSSGIGERRFLELVTQGGNAARDLNLASGDLLF